MDLKDYIKVYDDVLDPNVCRNAIKVATETEAERWDQDGRPSFNMINITLEAEKHKKQEWMKIHNELILAIKYASERYMLELDLRERFPPRNTIEQIRLKHYAANGIDRFDNHVDIGDHDSARRFLVLFFYLNDVEEGGETTKLPWSQNDDGPFWTCQTLEILTRMCATSHARHIIQDTSRTTQLNEI